MGAPSYNRSSRNPRNRSPSRRPNTKQTGERSEAAFLHRASGLGFGVAKPWGDSLRYDFILDNGERLWRIQIKCTESIRAQAYETRATYSVGKGRAAYTARDIDFLVVHVVPLDVWYVVPVAQCTPHPMLRFYPHRQAKKMRLEKYREAWHQLKPTHPGANGPITIQAVAGETLYPEVFSEEVRLDDECRAAADSRTDFVIPNRAESPVRNLLSSPPASRPPCRVGS